MAKRILLLDNSTPYILNTNKIETTNWELCLFCQKINKESITRPNGRSLQSGYVSIAIHLEEIKDLGALPFDIDIDRINDGSGIEQTLVKNNACYHKLCRLNLQKLLSKQSNTPKRKGMMNSTESSSLVKTRRKLEPTPTKKNFCFFCGEFAEDLHCASTHRIDLCVKEIATELRDSNLLTKLAACDMVSTDAKYHRKCYVDLRNRFRSHIRKTHKCDEENMVSSDALVLAELVAYIEESRNDEERAIIFKLSELKKIYVNRMAEIKNEDGTSIHTFH